MSVIETATKAPKNEDYRIILCDLVWLKKEGGA
jgi:hypothetical protein